MRQKADGQESEVMDLTADREPLFEHTLRFADVDGEGPPELVMLSCSGADTPERCEKGWIYRQAPDQPAFINLFAGGYHRLWLNAHYIVTETGSGAVGLPSTPQDMGQPVRRGSFLGPGHLTRQVYLRHPPKRPDALDLPNLPNENTVTWHHGLLFYADLDTATGQCSLHHPSQPDGAIRPLPTVPERLQRFCAVSFHHSRHPLAGCTLHGAGRLAADLALCAPLHRRRAHPPAACRLRARRPRPVLRRPGPVLPCLCCSRPVAALARPAPGPTMSARRPPSRTPPLPVMWTTAWAGTLRAAALGTLALVPLRWLGPLPEVAGVVLLLYLAMGAAVMVFVGLHLAVIGFVVHAFCKRHWRGKGLRDAGLGLLLSHGALGLFIASRAPA